ncbi:MAG: class I SAM-dependent methyltransferase [Flavobacteriales bacterium]|nr:class I SAM-dependent methyltransferase [Flavobacteriales bacterium]
MVYAHRMPTPQELAAVYDNYPVRDELNPVTRTRFHALLQDMEKYRQLGRLLDVGAGSGYFLDAARERGWTTFGTEHDPAVVERCRQRGAIMHQGPLDPANYPPGHFDVITSIEVIEHLVEPRHEVSHFFHLLRPGGLLYITTPNFRSLTHWLAGDQWDIVNWPEHLNYYTPRTLTRTLTGAGFMRERVRTTGVSPRRMLRARTRIKEENTDAGNIDQRLRTAIEGRWYLRAAKGLVNAGLDLFGIGDSLKAAFVKPLQ